MHERRDGKIADSLGSDPSHLRLPVLLLRARMLVVGRFRPAMRKQGISEQQFRILRALQFQDFVDVSALALRADLMSSSVSRILRDMESQDLIVRMPARDDARRSLVILTPRGRELVARTMIDVDALREALEAELGTELVDRARLALVEIVEKLLPSVSADAVPEE